MLKLLFFSSFVILRCLCTLAPKKYLELALQNDKDSLILLPLHKNVLPPVIELLLRVRHQPLELRLRVVLEVGQRLQHDYLILVLVELDALDDFSVVVALEHGDANSLAHANSLRVVADFIVVEVEVLEGFLAHGLQIIEYFAIIEPFKVIKYAQGHQIELLLLGEPHKLLAIELPPFLL